MAQNADALIALWDTVSKGTANMIHTAQAYGLIVVIGYYNLPESSQHTFFNIIVL